MKVTVTYYLEVISSWCHWAEPAWADLKKRYAGRPVEFGWKIALMDETGLPTSREQLDWFYRRSGLMVQSPYMLNSGWLEHGVKEYPAPNLVAEAVKDLGVSDDRARLALASAAMREGCRVGQWDESIRIAAAATGLDPRVLGERVRSPEIAARARATTDEFHALKMTMRPAFLVESNIGDRAVFSGLAQLEPIAATIDVMLSDAAGYAAHAAHFGATPT